MRKISVTIITIIFGFNFSYAQFTTSGSNIYYNSGNVGIGTTAPLGKLHVQAGLYDVLTAFGTFDIGLNSTPGGWARAFRVVNTSGSNGQDGGAFGVYGSATSPGYIYISIPTADPTGYNSTKILTLGNSGNVGIGNTTATEVLDVGNKMGAGGPANYIRINGLTATANTELGGIKFYNAVSTGFEVARIATGMGSTNVNDGYLAFSIGNSGAFNESMRITQTGNIGIGTTTPQTKLHIYQSTTNSSGLIIQGNTINSDNVQHYVAMTLDGDYGNATGNYSQIRSYSNLYSSWGSQLAFFTTQSNVANTLIERMRIDASGNVGIGTTTPDQKLSVAGTIHAKAVMVDLTGWPDYVFKPTYHLPPLEEIKTYINQNHHLPDLPSEQEVAKDGINLGEMNKLLTKKVEEMTLYLIAQKEQTDRQIKNLQEQINRLNKKSN